VTLKEFFDTYNGKTVCFDGYCQCVALAEHYAQEVLGIPVVWANAIDWFGQDAAYENWTANTPTNVTDEGAIIVWHADYRVGTGTYGHIAIVLGPSCGYPPPTATDFYSFDQNWPAGSGAHVVHHTSYYGVTGWGDKPAAPAPVAQAAAATAITSAAQLAADQTVIATLKAQVATLQAGAAAAQANLQATTTQLNQAQRQLDADAKADAAAQAATLEAQRIARQQSWSFIVTRIFVDAVLAILGVFTNPRR